MSLNETPPPELKPDDLVQLVSAHHPPLPAGDYHATVRHTIETAPDFVPARELEFSVRGERLALATEDVHAEFPPPGSSGKYSHVLPHVVLTRSTLPWERWAHEDVSDTRTSWLALLVLDAQDEAAVTTTQVSAGDLVGRPGQTDRLGSATRPWFPSTFSLEHAQHTDDQVTVLDVRWSTLQGILPRYDDLLVTAHVRRTGRREDGDWVPVSPEVALVTANRMPPASGECTVHLVSVEHRYHSPQADTHDPVPRPPINLGDGDLADRLREAAPQGPAATSTTITLTDRSEVLAKRPREGAPKEPATPDEVARATQDFASRLDTLLPAGSVWRQLLDDQSKAVFRTTIRHGDEDLGRVEVRAYRRRLPTVLQPIAVQGKRTGEGVLWSTVLKLTPLPPEPIFDAGSATADDLVRLVSLRSWSFTVEPEREGFLEGLHHLNHDHGDTAGFRLPIEQPLDADDPALTEGRRYVASGSVPLRHDLRGGGRTVSWYRGPFITDHHASVPVRLPARVADELLLHNQTLGMLDTGYAAAWQLGRMVALEDQHFATRLLTWKRRHARTLAHFRQQADRELLPLRTHRQGTDLPEDLADWMRSLTLLERLPFSYLVPDERLLPVESIRFFSVDSSWLACLRDGAFSIGRVLAKDHIDDAVRHEDLELVPQLSGFLLRSAIVADWPRLVVDGYTDVPRTPDPATDPLRVEPHPTAPRLRLERMARPGPNVLLCLFSDPDRQGRELQMVDLHLPPEVLHQGFETDEDGQLVKQLRRPADGEEMDGAVLPVPFRQTGASGPARVIDLWSMFDEVSSRLRADLPDGASTADLAFQLLDSPPLVRLRRWAGATDGPEVAHA